jgi:glycosyltransferase involved in cell wall biosynthesis
MKKIRILQINKLYYPDIGGIERTVQHIAEGLNDKVEMSVLVCQPEGRGVTEVVNNVPVQRCGSFGTLFSMPISLSFLWQLRRKSKGQDILQFHAPFPLGDLACLLSGYRGKVVLYWHSDVVKQKKLMILYRPIMEKFLKRTDAIIVGADGVINGSSYLKPYRNKCITIPFAVNEKIEQMGKRYMEQALPNMEKHAKFLFVGRLVYYKGVDVLIEAFTGVENAELTIIGCGDMEKDLKAYICEHGMSDRVHLLGKVGEDRLYREFSECDVFVLPSIAKSEAFGLVQLEAMAFGKPVINTNLPSGVPEVSLNGITGLTVEPGNKRELGDAMRWFVEHPTERCEMGNAARERLDSNYTLDVMMNRMMELYGRLLKDG